MHRTLTYFQGEKKLLALDAGIDRIMWALEMKGLKFVCQSSFIVDPDVLFSDKFT